MKANKFSDFDNYTILADNSDLGFGYEAFLRLKEVKQFLSQISSTTGDTFLYNGNIYNNNTVQYIKKKCNSVARALLHYYLSSFF